MSGYGAFGIADTHQLPKVRLTRPTKLARVVITRNRRMIFP